MSILDVLVCENNIFLILSCSMVYGQHNKLAYNNDFQSISSDYDTFLLQINRL